MQRPPDKRKTAPACDRGGSKFDSKKIKIEYVNYSSPNNPVATPAKDPISVKYACERSGEKPATIINWIIKFQIGAHIKSGRGHSGEWAVYPDRLERLLAEREASK